PSVPLYTAATFGIPLRWEAQSSPSDTVSIIWSLHPPAHSSEMAENSPDEHLQFEETEKKNLVPDTSVSRRQEEIPHNNTRLSQSEYLHPPEHTGNQSLPDCHFSQQSLH